MTISERKTTDLSALKTKIELSAGRKNNLWFMVQGEWFKFDINGELGRW